MVTDLEIAALLYLKDDGKIANYLGVSLDRVSAVRAKKGQFTKPPVLEKVIEEALAEEPLKQASVLIPNLCPTCGSPIEGRLMVTHIQALVAAYYQMPVRAMVSAQRCWKYSHPRQIAMYLASELTPKSLPDIGQRFGGRDHTTVMYAIKVVQQRMLADAEIEADVKALRERLAT